MRKGELALDAGGYKFYCELNGAACIAEAKWHSYELVKYRGTIMGCKPCLVLFTVIDFELPVAAISFLCQRESHSNKQIDRYVYA